jgi:hypothetical protein
VTYGDIVGDGGTEAVVPIDSGGSIGEIGSLVYRLGDSGTPRLLVAPGPGGTVFIDPNASELVAVGFDPSCSSLRCPKLVRTGFKLVSGVLQQQDTCNFLASSADQAHPQGTCTSPSPGVQATPVPASALLPTFHRSDLAQVRDLPLPILLPPAGLQPFSAWSADMVSVVPFGSSGYLANFGVQDSAPPSSDTESIQGYTDPQYGYPTTDPKGCDTSGQYCAYIDPDAGHKSELFRGLQVRGTTSGMAIHTRTDPTEEWDLYWLDPLGGLSYRLLVGGKAAADYGTTLSPGNRSGAEALAGLANQLVIWSKN